MAFILALIVFVVVLGLVDRGLPWPPVDRGVQ